MTVHFDYAYFRHFKNKAVESYSKQLIPKKSTYRLENKEADIAQSEWGLHLLLLRLLQVGTLTPDPRREEILVETWEVFVRANSGVDFSLEDLLNNGWVRIIWDKWYIPRNFIHFKRTQSKNLVFLFLQQLSNISYSDEREVILPFSIKEELDFHRVKYPNLPDFEWFLSKKVIIKDEKQLKLNLSNELIIHFASFILGKLWEEKIAGPKEPFERLTWWKNYYECVNGGYDFFEDVNISGRKEFLDAAAKRLLIEEDCVGWEAESLKIAVEGLIRFPEKPSIVPGEFYPPSSNQSQEIDKLDWLSAISHTEAGIVSDGPRDLLRMLFSFVAEYDESVGKIILRKIIKHRKTRPFIYKLISEGNGYNQILPYLLLEEDTAVLGLYNLIHYEAKAEEGYWNERMRKRQNDLTKRDFEEGLSFFAYMLHQQSVEKAADLILESVQWLYRQLRKPILHNKNIQVKRKEQLESLLEMIVSMPRHSNDNNLFIDDILPELLSKLDGLLSNSKCPLKEELWPFLLWLMEKRYRGELQDSNDLLGIFSEKVVQFYIESFKNQDSYHRWIEVIEKEIESKGWLFIGEEVFKRKPFLWSSFLNPADFFSMVSSVSSEKRYGIEQRAVVGQIRTHIRLLAFLTIESKAQQKKLSMVNDIDTKVHHLSSLFQIDNPTAGKFDVFDTYFEYNPLIGQIGAELPLFELVASAINGFSDEMRERVLKELIKLPLNTRRISVLYSRMKRKRDKELVLTSIEYDMAIKNLDSMLWLTEVQNMVKELLNTGSEEFANIANDVMDYYKEHLTQKQQLDWIEWEFGERLRAHFILGNDEEILKTVISEELRGKEAVRRTYDFFRGLVGLRSDDAQMVRQSVGIFQSLTKIDPSNFSYRVNDFAANVRLLENRLKEESIAIEEIKEFKKKLNQLFVQFESDFSAENNQNQLEVLIENRLFMLILLKDWVIFWQTYYHLSADLQLQYKIGTYAVQIYMEHKEWEKADQLLQKLIQRHGNTEWWIKLENEVKIQQTDLLVEAPTVINSLNSWESIGHAFLLVKGMNMFDQAKAYCNNEAATFKDVLVNEVFHACYYMKQFAPTLLKYTIDKPKQAEEDHYNDLLALFLNQSLRKIGWSAATQTRGGFTGRQTNGAGGIGERDIIIQNADNREITIIEALRLQSARKKEILQHFQKIFAYDSVDSDFYFMISWGFNDNPMNLWEKYREIVKSWSSGEYSVVDSGEIKALLPLCSDTSLLSFYTKHQSDDGREIFVIHLYVDVKMNSKQELAEKKGTV